MSVKTEEQLRKFRPSKHTFVQKNRDKKEGQGNGRTILEGLSSERGSRFYVCSSRIRTCGWKLLGGSFQLYIKNIFQQQVTGGTLNSSEFLITEAVEEEANHHISWIPLKNIPLRGENIYL